MTPKEVSKEDLIDIWCGVGFLSIKSQIYTLYLLSF